MENLNFVSLGKTYFNKHFRFLFIPKIYYEDKFFKELYGYNSGRFLVGAGRLRYYIGEKNAETVLKTAQNMQTDKTIVKFRKAGKIIIYNK